MGNLKNKKKPSPFPTSAAVSLVNRYGCDMPVPAHKLTIYDTGDGTLKFGDIVTDDTICLISDFCECVTSMIEHKGAELFEMYQKADKEPVKQSDKVNIKWHELKCGDKIAIMKCPSSKEFIVEVLSFRKVMAITKHDNGQFELFEPGEFNDLFLAIKVDPKPRVKVEYVECDDSIFDLKDDFHAKKLYCKHSELTFEQVRTIDDLADSIVNSSLYRKVEREVTWQDKISENFNIIIDNGEVGMLPISQDKFIEMCHLVSSMNK